ncbi:MAG TPA: hypothetical protein VJB99_03965 [Patescibacteria group bacterium]|nr:hypothetical protein [Patescibacteria group bacterium]
MAGESGPTPLETFNDTRFTPEEMQHIRDFFDQASCRIELLKKATPEDVEKLQKMVELKKSGGFYLQPAIDLVDIIADRD